MPLIRVLFVLAAVALFARGAMTQQDSVTQEAFDPPPSRLANGQGEGRARLRPDGLNVATIGTYELTYEVGESGIAEGGGLLVAFPKAWFVNPFPLGKPLQRDDADAPHYIAVETSRDGAELSLEIDRVGLTGKLERFNRTMTIEVSGASLTEGDEIALTLANTTAPYVAGPDEVTVAVDADGSGQFKATRRGADYEIYGGAGVELVMTGPSQAVIGKPVTFHMTAFDSFGNRTETFVGVINITGLSEERISTPMGTAEMGQLAIEWTPTEEGVHFPVARAQAMGSTETPGFKPFLAVGPPIRVTAAESESNVYWGDLHSHSRISKDAIGKNDFAYARIVTRLDFFGSSEHVDDDGRPLGDGINPAEWETIKTQVNDLYAPGSFATLLGYECSLGSGHHNVFFRSAEGVPWPAHELGGIEALFGKLASGQAIAIPHHLGISWGGANGPLDGAGHQTVRTADGDRWGGPWIDWSGDSRPAVRPSLEIYSLHGNSEFYDPEDPLAYESVKFTGARSHDGPHYARDAWLAGHRLGVIAASDNHTARPGPRQGGLTAVLAPELTREAVFDALAARRSYATTGERIIMGFTLGGAVMGEEISGSASREGSVTIAAPGEIAYAEVLAADLDKGEMTSVKRWDKPGNLLEDGYRLNAGLDKGMVYLRVELAEPVRERVVRGWTSPIWFGD